MLWIVLGFLLVVGCAARPESIAPAYISEMTYKDWTCEELAQERLRLAAALSTACDAQRQARDNDTVGVILIGLPVSSLSGSNMAAEIARLKGELQALQKMATLKDCNLPDIPDPVAEKRR
jgi:hypothetical protein